MRLCKRNYFGVLVACGWHQGAGTWEEEIFFLGSLRGLLHQRGGQCDLGRINSLLREPQRSFGWLLRDHLQGSVCGKVQSFHVSEGVVGPISRNLLCGLL